MFVNKISHRIDKKELSSLIEKAFCFISKKGKDVICLTDRDFDNTKYNIQCFDDINKINNIKDYNYIVYFDNDDISSNNINKITKNKCKYISCGKYYPVSKYYHTNILAKKCLVQSYDEVVTHVRKYQSVGIEWSSKFNLEDYTNIIQAIEMTKNIKGCYMEIGVMYGDSANVAANYMNMIGLKRDCYFFDTYEGFKYKEAKESSDILWNGTHYINTPENHMKMVSDLVEKNNSILDINVKKNNIITDSLPENIKLIACCNIDVDMEEAVAVALEKVCDLIPTHGIIICEDCGHTPALIGAFTATRNFINSDKGKNFIPVQIGSGQTFLIRK